MDDLISRQEAIDAHYEYCNKHSDAGFPVWSLKILENLPSAQPDSKELSFTQKKLDTISRQAAIRWVKTECNPYGKPTLDFESGKKVIEHLKQMPSAQPETHEERTETHACDCISRQAAVEAIENTDWYHLMDGVMVRGANSNEHQAWYKEQDIYKALEQLPSAQPDSKELSFTQKKLDTISRQEAVSVIAKWMLEYGGEGEERERNALKQAAEEIKEFPSAQPDLSEYSDKLWKAAYERGKAEAQQRWIPCSERLPDDLAEVIVTWVNHEPETYYDFIKDKPFTAPAVYYKGKWFWWTQYTQDLLSEYCERCNVGEVDKAIEIIAWMPLPEPYGRKENR